MKKFTNSFVLGDIDYADGLISFGDAQRT